MSPHDDGIHRRANDGLRAAPDAGATRFVRPAQRDLVIASLLRCPDRGLSAKGRKRA
jgi:hypothetical protein